MRSVAEVSSDGGQMGGGSRRECLVGRMPPPEAFSVTAVVAIENARREAVAWRRGKRIPRRTGTFPLAKTQGSSPSHEANEPRGIWLPYERLVKTNLVPFEETLEEDSHATIEEGQREAADARTRLVMVEKINIV